MSTLDPERVDLAALVAHLRHELPEAPRGAISGRTVMRDVVAKHLGCSALEAEKLVDTLVARGFARLERAADDSEHWLFGNGA